MLVLTARKLYTIHGTIHDTVLGGAATCSECFVRSLLIVPLACLGSMAAPELPNSLWNSQKKVYKTFGTSGRLPV